MTLYLPPAVGRQSDSYIDPRLVKSTAWFGGGSAQSIASYIEGQCTWYVAKLADWVPPHWGDAKTWPANAKAQGYVVTTKPQAGAVVSWPGLSSYGHVGLVKSVNPDGSFVVDEMNYSGGPFNKDTRTVPSPQGAEFILPPGTNTAVTNATTDVATALTHGLSPVTWMQDIANAFSRPVNDLVIDSVLIVVGLCLVLVGVLIIFQVNPVERGKNTAKTGVKVAAVIPK